MLLPVTQLFQSFVADFAESVSVSTLLFVTSPSLPTYYYVYVPVSQWLPGKAKFSASLDNLPCLPTQYQPRAVLLQSLPLLAFIGPHILLCPALAWLVVASLPHLPTFSSLSYTRCPFLSLRTSSFFTRPYRSRRPLAAGFFPQSNMKSELAACGGQWQRQ